MATYRKIDDIDSFNNLVDNFLDTRDDLKSKVKEQKSTRIETERVGQPPLTKKEAQFQPIVNAFGNYLELFNNFANSNRSSTEIKLSTKPNIGRIGKFGEVDLTDLQDNRLRIYNTNTKENLSRDINDSVAELLIKPYTKIDYARLDAGAYNEYMEIMRFAGIPRGANNNRKLRQPGQPRQPRQNAPQQGPQQPPQAPNLPPQPRRPRQQGPQQPPNLPPNNNILNPEDEDDVIMNDQLPPEREQRGPPPRQAQYRREAQDRGMRRRRQQFLNQAMRQGIGFEGEEKDDDGFRRLPQGRDAVRRRRNQRGLPPRNQRGRGFFSSPEEMVDRLDLLVGSLDAGNDSDNVVNEVMDIVDELKDLKILTALQHKKFLKKYINI